MKGIGTLYAPQQYRATATGNLVQDICHQSWVYSIPKKICQAAGFQRGERSSMIQGRSRDEVNSGESGKKRRQQLRLAISSEINGPEDRSQLLLAKDLQEGGPVSEEEVELVDYKLN